MENQILLGHTPPPSRCNTCIDTPPPAAPYIIRWSDVPVCMLSMAVRVYDAFTRRRRRRTPVRKRIQCSKNLNIVPLWCCTHVCTRALPLHLCLPSRSYLPHCPFRWITMLWTPACARTQWNVDDVVAVQTMAKQFTSIFCGAMHTRTHTLCPVSLAVFPQSTEPPKGWKIKNTNFWSVCVRSDRSRGDDDNIFAHQRTRSG